MAAFSGADLGAFLGAEVEMETTAVLDGRLHICQPVKGHRIGTDGILLAACLPSGSSGLVLDIGAGVGAVGLAAALRAPAAEFRLVERDGLLAAAAKSNIARNGLSARVQAVQADLLAPKARRAAGLLDGMASFVLTNPPFDVSGTVSASPNALKKSAYLREGTLADWLRAATALLAPKGRLILIHRASALAEVLDACRGRLGALRILPVYPRAGAPASRLLVCGTKGSRTAPCLLPGLILHEGEAFTAQAEAVHRGRAAIDLS